MSNDRFSPLHEVLPELAGAHEAAGLHEYESEYEDELESEAEAEAGSFFDRLASLAAGGGISPARRLAAAAAESAVAGLHEAGLHEFEDAREVSPLARVLPGLAGGGGLDPISRVYPEALMEMEHLGHIAAEAHTEAEAEAHARRIVPVAVRTAPVIARRVAHVVPRPAHILVPMAVHAVRRAAPALAQGVSGVVRTLYRNPTTRHLIRTVPAIVGGTTQQLIRRAAMGRPVTPLSAVQTLARQAARVVANPSYGVRAWRRSRALDRRYHRAIGAGIPGVWSPGIGVPRPAAPVTWGPGIASAPGASRPGLRRAGGCGCGCCCACRRCRSGS